jgi:uncharacterized membrane-anchored protein
MRVLDVPAGGPRFWTAISIASVFGANLGDAVSHDLHLGHARGLPFEAAVFAVILLTKQRVPVLLEVCYWLGIVTLRTAATNVGDLLTHDLCMPYDLACALIAVCFIPTLVVPDKYRLPATGLSRGVPPTSGRYWLAMFLAGTLGTVAGDGVADGLGMGVQAASALLAALVALLLGLRRVQNFRTGALYWATIFAIRTAGTTLGDLTAHSMGLIWSTGASGAALLVTLVAWPVPRAVSHAHGPFAEDGAAD